MIYYKNTNPDWIPLFKQFMESKGRNDQNFNFRSSLCYYINDEFMIDGTDKADPSLVTIFNPSMMEEQKEIKINIPHGYEIDSENSTFECIRFKKKPLTYTDIANKLFKHHTTYYINEHGIIEEAVLDSHILDLNNATSQKQLQKLLAINKLMNIAKYFNGNNWKPFEYGEPCYTINIVKVDPCKVYEVDEYYCDCGFLVYFRDMDDCKLAIDILGNETLDLIFSTDW